MLNIEKVNNKYVVSFRKDVNRFNLLISDSVKDILEKFISHPKSSLVLDLEGIKFIDSTGFAALLSILEAARENNCSFQFKNVDPEVMELLELVKLKETFELCEN